MVHWRTWHLVITMSLILILQAQGGRLGYIQTSPKLEDEVADAKPAYGLLAYMNSNYEYVLFNPYGEQGHNQIISHWQNLSSLEEKGNTLFLPMLSKPNRTYWFDQKLAQKLYKTLRIKNQ